MIMMMIIIIIIIIINNYCYYIIRQLLTIPYLKLALGLDISMLSRKIHLGTSPVGINVFHFKCC
jgi:hypothetical protein